MSATTPAKFWSKVDRREPDECWPWLGHKIRRGYGMVGYEKRNQPAHRIAYLFTYGEFDRALDVCHKCDNPPCCNPKHLFLGTARDNVLDAIAKGRWSTMRGEKSPRAILSDAQVRDILTRWRPVYGSAASLAREFSVSEGCIWGIVTRRNRQDVIL